PGFCRRIRRKERAREKTGDRRGIADRAARAHPRRHLAANYIDRVQIEIDVLAPGFDGIPRVLASAFKPCALAAARVVAEHRGVRAEAFGDRFDGGLNRGFIRDVALKSMDMSGDRRRSGGKLLVDDRDLVDHLFVEKRGYDPQSQSARSSSYDCVFHWRSPSRSGDQR